ncbi:L-serine ammonia-lyase [Gluconobacter japonicus]|uniref:L-serine ammonia-lyase n=1 Tax=Gluconobacter japonicus TaxID=376620 RepID=UPI001B8CA80E|nr:L-serine ammonia-lyase [Gluconobacter japonicus]MBS1049467.1 L-serine ammonia-lyase [Gluconobacter japonicus]
MISLFDLFRIGFGPSSSHTVGPMRAGLAFVQNLPADTPVSRIQVTLYGSLAWTGVGHATDTAVLLGLEGWLPDNIAPDHARHVIEQIQSTKRLTMNGQTIRFDPVSDVVFDYETVPPVHPNTLQFEAFDTAGNSMVCERYCSIGGGFIVPEETSPTTKVIPPVSVPYDVASAHKLLEDCRATGLSIAELIRANETTLRADQDVTAYIDRILDTMMDCIDRGLREDGVLPGKLHVKRRAPALFRKLENGVRWNQRAPHEIMDWVSLFAIAVNEENAAGGRIVTAPTNGASGVIPAVLRYYRDFCPGASREGMREFLLTATAIGALFKRNASISGAEVGCQGEVGVACSMAAAGLAAALGATPDQVENAAEIGMEHHLGMTCDPVGGLVQIPCIERNAFGAIKAINAASLAMRGDGVHHVSLDQVIRTMRETGADMNHRYKETSLGGLAVSFPEC